MRGEHSRVFHFFLAIDHVLAGDSPEFCIFASQQIITPVGFELTKPNLSIAVSGVCYTFIYDAGILSRFDNL